MRSSANRASSRLSGRTLPKQQRGEVAEVSPPHMPGVFAGFDHERVLDAVLVEHVTKQLVLAEHSGFLGADGQPEQAKRGVRGVRIREQWPVGLFNGLLGNLRRPHTNRSAERP